MIEFQQINKTYRVARRQAGMGNAVKAFFHREYETIHALKDVNFTVIGYLLSLNVGGSK